MVLRLILAQHQLNAEPLNCRGALLYLPDREGMVLSPVLGDRYRQRIVMRRDTQLRDRLQCFYVLEDNGQPQKNHHSRNTESFPFGNRIQQF